MKTNQIAKLLFKSNDTFQHFQKLLQYGFMNGIQSIGIMPNLFKNEICGELNNATKTITIFIPLTLDTINDKQLITVLAHEIGHFLSLNFANDNEYMFYLFHTIEKAKNTRKPISAIEKCLILEEELFAWENAKSLLKELNILKHVENDLHDDFHYSYENYLEIPALNDY